VPIVPSRSRRIQQLLGRLASESAAERESGVAGLTLLGTRVVEPLGAFLPGATRAARLAALEVLERIGDRAALPRILDLVADTDETIALRALEAAGNRADPRAVPTLAAVLQGRGKGPRRRGAALALARLQAAGLVEALDPLAARLLDEGEEAGLRVAILDALLTLRPRPAPATLRPLLKRLAASSDPELRARAKPQARGTALDERLVVELVAPGLSDAAVERVTAALARRGAPAIPALRAALERLGPPRRGLAHGASLRARAAIHQALAALNSRVALYDLRETLASRPRAVMPALLRAAGRIGDASVVPVLAGVVAEEAELLDPCAEALAAIAAREKLRKTSSAHVPPALRAALDTLWARAKASPTAGPGRSSARSGRAAPASPRSGPRAG
jgi:HEAT repeat protein